MKILTAIAIAAALSAAATTAGAQNAAPTTKVTPSPSNINRSNLPTVQSGAQAPSTAANRHARVTGTGKFSRPSAANGRLSCHYASMNACEKHNKSSNLKCVANPRS